MLVIFTPLALLLYFLYPYTVDSVNFEFQDPRGIICAHFIFTIMLYFLYPYTVDSVNFEFGGIICAHLFSFVSLS
jgi:hypothetical protein